MAYEVFANDLNPPSSTLAVAVTTVGQTSIQVASAANFSTIPNFRIRLGNEIMLVTAVAGAVFTVTRGVEGTTASTYSIGANVDQLLTAGAVQQVQQAGPQFTNTSSFVYTFDVTNSNLPDVTTWHGRTGNTAYVCPAPTQGRKIRWLDKTGAIQTSTNWVSFVPNAGEKINGSTGFTLSGGATFHFTNGSANVTLSGGKATQELYVGASVASSNQAGVNYIVLSITNVNAFVLNSNFTGTTTTTATATRTSLQVSANGVEMSIDTDGTDWIIRGNGVPTKISFTGDGTLIIPAGVTSSDFVGSGGGGGGGSGALINTATNRPGGGGGAGAIERTVRGVTVTGNTAYAVTQGVGGTGGLGTSSIGAGNDGGQGGTTTVGSLVSFEGASGGQGGPGNATQFALGGLPFLGQTAGGVQSNAVTGVFNGIDPQGNNRTNQAFVTLSCGGSAFSNTGFSGAASANGFAGGVAGSAASTAGGGGGGGGGGRDLGSAGGAGSNTTGSSPSNPTANSGAGGGGSGAASGASATASANAANGANGYVDCIYVL